MASSLYQTGFYFALSFQGISAPIDASFQEASGLGKETKLDELACGGENRFKYRVPSATSFQNLVLKRGVASQKSPLIQWVARTLNDGLSEPIQMRNIKLALLNSEGKPCSSWSFVNAYPVKWSASDLKSQESSILVETIEFGYHYFDVTPINVVAYAKRNNLRSSASAS